MTKKIWELPELASISDDDLFVVADDPAGTPTTRYITAANLNYASKSAANVFTAGPQQITIDAAGNKGFIIKGANSQTANLQEWQNSSGTVVGSIAIDGSITTRIATVPSNGTRAIFRSIETYGDFIIDQGQWTAYGIGISAPYGLKISANGASSYGGLQLHATHHTLVGTSASNVTLSVKGASSQTANPFEVQNSSGSAIAYITAAGVFTGNGSGLTNISHSALSALDYASSGHTGFAGVDVANVFSLDQTLANSKALKIQVFGGSSARSLVRLDNGNNGYWQNEASGNATYGALAGTTYINGSGFRRLTLGTGTTSILINELGNHAGNVHLAIRGASSQTANLTEWRDSNDNLLASINASGVFSGVASSSILRTTFASRPAAGAAGRLWIQSDGPYIAYDDGSTWRYRYSTAEVKPPTWLDSVTWVNQNTRTLSSTYGYGSLIAPTNNGQVGGVLKSISVPYDVRMAFTRGAEVNLSSEAGFFIKKDSDDKLLTFACTGANNFYRADWNSYSSFSGNYLNTTYSVTPPGAIIYMRVVNPGSGVRTFYVSSDGINWLSLNTNGATEWINGEDRIGIYSFNNSNLQTNLQLVHWEEV